MADSSVSEVVGASSPKDKNEQATVVVVTTTTDQENASSNNTLKQGGSSESTTGNKEKPASNPFQLRSSILTPSKLNTSSTQTKPSFFLNPSRLKPAGDDESKEVPSSSSTNITISSNKSDLTNGTPKLTFLPLLQNGSTTPKKPAVTIASSTTTSTASPLAATNSTFVFGQNLEERVESAAKKPKLDDAAGGDGNNAASTTTTVFGNVSTVATSNGNTATDDMLFSSALAGSSNSSLTTSSAATPNKSLSESAREYEESRAVKRKYEEVEVKTGEEDEINVLQITCKLFAFDNSGGFTSWQERGRGILRLNDSVDTGNDGNSSHSRLVFRTSGSLRVILNTKVWSGMSIETASNKSVRITALDSNGEIKVFLLMGSSEDVKQLKKLLEKRVQEEVTRQKTQKETTVALAKTLDNQA